MADALPLSCRVYGLFGGTLLSRHPVSRDSASVIFRDAMREAHQRLLAASVDAGTAYRLLADGLYARLCCAAGDDFLPTPHPVVDNAFDPFTFTSRETDDSPDVPPTEVGCLVIGPEALGMLAEEFGYDNAATGRAVPASDAARRHAGAWYTPPAERRTLIRVALALGLAARFASDDTSSESPFHAPSHDASKDGGAGGAVDDGAFDLTDEAMRGGEREKKSGRPVTVADWFQWLHADESPDANLSPFHESTWTPEMGRRVAAALAAWRMIDPSCGAGGFLLTARDELHRLDRRLARFGMSPPSAPRLFGEDIAPWALVAAARRLALASGDTRQRARWRIAPPSKFFAPGTPPPPSSFGTAPPPTHDATGTPVPTPPDSPSVDGGARSPRSMAFTDGATFPSGASSAAWVEEGEVGLMWRDALAPPPFDEEKFDVVMGNPPFVQYKRIAPPSAPSPWTFDDGTEGAAAYRARLAARVLAADPGFWGADGRDAPVRWSGRSDLYLYFLTLGFARVASGGVLAFVTPEAWMDVESGRAWQALLLERADRVWITTHAERQSFDAADVDTVLLAARRAASDGGRAATARVVFASLRRMFSEALSTGAWTPALAALDEAGDAGHERVVADPSWTRVSAATLWRGDVPARSAGTSVSDTTSPSIPAGGTSSCTLPCPRLGQGDLFSVLDDGGGIGGESIGGGGEVKSTSDDLTPESRRLIATEEAFLEPPFFSTSPKNGTAVHETSFPPQGMPSTDGGKRFDAGTLAPVRQADGDGLSETSPNDASPGSVFPTSTSARHGGPNSTGQSVSRRLPYAGGKWGGTYLRAAGGEDGVGAWWATVGASTCARLCRLDALVRVSAGIKHGGYGRYLAAFDAPDHDGAVSGTPDAGGMSAASEEAGTDMPLPVAVLKNPRRHGRMDLDRPDARLVPEEAVPAVHAKAARGGPPVLWLAGRGDTHKVWINTGRWAHTGNFLGLDPDGGVDPVLLAALLNSVWVALVSERVARGKGIGGGACVFSAMDLRAIDVPDLRALDEATLRRWRTEAETLRALPFASMRARAEAVITQAKTASLRTWAAWDHQIFDFLEMSKSAREDAARALIAQVARRRRKARPPGKNP